MMNIKVEESIERIVGLPIETIRKLTVEEEIAHVEKVINKKLIFTKKSRKFMT